MPSSPQTPTRSRKPSNIDIPFSTPLSDRRHSKTSLHTPTSPRGSLVQSDSIGNDLFSSGGGGAGNSNGLGNLADELADAWDEEEDEEGEEPDMNFQEGEAPSVDEDGGEEGQNGASRDSGVDVSESGKKRNKMLNPPQQQEADATKHHRRNNSTYDGNDYGEDSDMESPGMPLALVARIDMVESLARRGTESNGGDRDGVFKRVVDGLKDLSGQSAVEGGASRLITAHTALSSHLLHQTRQLHSLTYPLISPFSLPPPPELIDELLPLLLTISDSMPRPTTAALSSLANLHALTADLVQTLNYLSDSLHVSRQTTTKAMRGLKSARELVAELRREEEAREEGERWLRRGNWSERLGKRESARVCGDVVGGFEEVCNGWRERLLAQAGQETVGA